MRDIIQQHGLEVSMAMMLIIVAIAVFGFFYIRNQKKKEQLLNHRGIIEMWPSFVSTLGVLGTFAGR